MTNMTRRSLPQVAITQIKAAGFRVYMRARSDSWALCASRAGIAYVQYDPAAGFTVGTVHKPNHESGTGYQIARHVYAVDSALLESAARTIVPSWASHKSAPVKYRDMDQYRAESTFNAAYAEV